MALTYLIIERNSINMTCLFKGTLLFFISCIFTPCLSESLDKNKILLDGSPVSSLSVALHKAKDGSLIELGAGVYQDGGYLQASFVTIRGEKGTHLKNYSTKGKGTLVIKGNDTHIENIECSQVSVSDKNGSCIRLEGKNITIEKVYFHDSEQGILTGSQPGKVFIDNSRFERLGKSGRAHGIYIGGGELYVHNSKFLSSKDEGHEIKSRAKKNIISNTIIASLNGYDSRLIDISHGGILELRNSVLEQGNNTSNYNLIGFGLEGMKYKENSIIIKNNMFLLNRDSGSLILKTKRNIEHIEISDNDILGLYKDNFDQHKEKNNFFKRNSDIEAGDLALFLKRR